MRLFVERASDRRPGFALLPANAAAVAEICRRLEGVPLAIELAAARVGPMSVEQIAERLGDSLGLLTGGGRTAVARQRTLRGALDWSHELLSNQEQTLFGRLSVFAGGWTLEAAEAVAAGGGIGEADVLELLSGLVDKSLVEAEASREGGVRYRLLEPVRQYALEKLEHSGEAEAVRRRRTEYFLALAEEAYPELLGANQLQWLDRLEAEHDNLRAALSWTLGGGAPRLGLRLAATLFRFWDGRGYQSEGSAWLREALSKGSNATDSSARAMALVGLGIILVKQGNFEQAEACLNEALTLYEGLGDQGGAAKSLLELGWLEFERGATTRATALFEESLAVARASGNRMIVPEILHGLANAVLSYGDHKRADRLLEEALASFRERGDAVEGARVLFTMGYAELALGDQVRATRLLEESLALARKFGDRDLMGGCLLSLGISATLRGDPERAKTLLKESLEMGVEMGNKRDIAENLEGLAEVAGALGEDVRAARIWGAAGGLREAIGRPWWSAERLLHEPQLSAARVRLDQAAWEAAFEVGQVMSLEEAVEYALSEQMSVTSEAPAPDQPSAIKQSSALSAREREVAALVARGHSSRWIAQELFLSERTIEKHVSKILRKLHLSSRAEIAAWATQQGLIAPEPA